MLSTLQGFDRKEPHLYLNNNLPSKPRLDPAIPPFHLAYATPYACLYDYTTRSWMQ